MSRKQQQIDNTKQWILQAYIKLLGKRDDKSISISSIALEAGVGRQTFYRHFRSKECLVREVLDEVYDELLIRLMALRGQDQIDKQVFTTIFQWWREQPMLHVLYKSESFHKEFAAERRKVRLFAQEQLGFKPAETSYAAQFREGGINNVFMLWIQNGMNESPERMATILVEQCLRDSV